MEDNIEKLVGYEKIGSLGQYNSGLWDIYKSVDRDSYLIYDRIKKEIVHTEMDEK